jgi:nitroreductase
MSESLSVDAWHIDPQQFPHGGSGEEQLRFALRYAVLAPSGHNTQPWEFAIHGDAVEVFADQRRALPVVDPSGRELVLSCGAAVFFLRTALRRFGLATETVLYPREGDRRLVARVRLAGTIEPTATDVTLADAIVHRHTNRRPFDDRPVDPELTRALTRSAHAAGAWMADAADASTKRALAALVAQANREQYEDPAFRGELASWVRDPDAEDGLLTHGVALAEAGERADVLPVRTFEHGGGVAATDRKLAEGSPLLAVIGTDSDDERSWMAAGQALGHVLLQACAEGLSASFLNQPIEVAHLRPLVAEAVGHSGHAHLLLRIGHGVKAAASARRPVDDVIVDG